MEVNGYKIGPKADLARANLQASDLAGANLEGANLQLADLTDANLKGVNLSRAGSS